MKQVVQNYKSGKLWLEDVPIPICRPGGILVRNEFSVVSTGTERMKIDQARMSMVEKARARPDQVKQVLQSVRQVGLMETYDKVQERLDALTTLGYSSIGRVVEVGAGLDELAVDDRVVCAGEGIACHAEYVFVPKNLCASVPDGVDPRDAVFATIGAIAMNGVRQAKVGIGDSVLVIGLGLVGLLGVQILKAAGCRVIGMDVAEDKLDLAMASGAEAAFSRSDPSLMEGVNTLTKGRGVDAVYVAASSKSSDPLDVAGELVRDRGSIIIVGMIPIQADWRSYYMKELSIFLSRSYGPGRYDRNFEVKGIDYPVGFIPWTQKRNLEEFVRLVAEKIVSPTRFGPKEVPFEEAPEAYKQVHESPGQYATGVIFRYRDEKIDEKRTVRIVREDLPRSPADAKVDSVRVGLIGAGNFATGTLIPALKKSDCGELRGICSAGGLSAKSAATKHGFNYATSDIEDILNDEAIDAVVIATRHDTHADFAVRALNSGKFVFVEKPLGLSLQEIDAVRIAQSRAKTFVMPGYNRRFSPLSEAVRGFFSSKGGPLEVVCRINAGFIASDSWYQDAQEGGWRIVSEGCHWIDLISYLTNALPVGVTAMMVGGEAPGAQNDNCIATIELSNGCIATLAYLSNGDPHFEKERIEVFGQDKVAVIDNWRHASLSSGGKVRKAGPRKTGKGHTIEMNAFVNAVKTRNACPISIDSAIATSVAALKIQESLLDSGQYKKVEL